MTANALALPNVSFFFICQDSLLLNIFILFQVNLGHLRSNSLPVVSQINMWLIPFLIDRSCSDISYWFQYSFIWAFQSSKIFHCFFLNFDNLGENFLKFFLAGDDSFDGHQSRPLPLERSNHFHVHKLRFHKC